MLPGGDYLHRLRIRARLRRASITLAVRSRRLVRGLVARMELLIALWLGCFGLAAALRIAFAPVAIDDARAFVEIFLPYGLAALAPIAGYRLTMAVFPHGHLPARAGIRFARLGRWKRLDPIRARAHPQFGPFGFMASLLIGMLLNIPVRSFEFLAAMPALNGNAPVWGWAMFWAMAADVIVMNFLYAVCFTMALRTAPLFPRMLLFAWGIDLLFQLAIAREVAAQPGLPADIAAALEGLLRGNVTKVLISAGLWLPYLLLSQRVNVTYRGRIAP